MITPELLNDQPVILRIEHALGIPIAFIKSMREKFDYSLHYKKLNLRKNPELYRVGIGEQGVLLVEPYKSEILPHWRFKTPKIARQSAVEITALFFAYKSKQDFIGMDLARKFLQMGFTRSRRYANHKSGQKYKGPVSVDKKGQSGSHGRDTLPRVEDEVKAESARIFFLAWKKIEQDEIYITLKSGWKILFG